MKKKVRSISGILPLTVVLKPQKCKHGKCIYCPSQEGIPESYTRTSAPILRAIDCGYDPEKQVKVRLKIYKLMEHPTDKIELIVLGGTFSDYPLDYQEQFIKSCFDGLNGTMSNDLKQAQKINETAKNRCVGLCLETRPDSCTIENINKMLEYGATRIEIGVQCLDNKIYETTQRGHTVEDVVKATNLLRQSSMKIGYHVMLGLPDNISAASSSRAKMMKKDIQNIETIFNDERFKPDQLKIYPTFVIKGTKLEKIYEQGKYKPYTTEEIINLLIEIKKRVPAYVRVMRVMRDIPAQHIVSDCVYSHLRDAVHKKMKEKGIKCNCIRCREIGHKIRKNQDFDKNFKLKRTIYNAGNGKEIFLSYESTDTIVSLLRLRISSESFRPEITKDTALIRELHTFGPMVPIKEKGNFYQHKGFGKKLMQEAERIAKEEFNCNKMVVISAIGTREYFYKLGYKLDGFYVSKKL